MSPPAVVVALEESAARGNRRLVLAAIAASARPDGAGAWPSQATVARRAGLSEKTVRGHVKALADSGELDVKYKAGPRGCNAYVIVAAARAHAADGGDPLRSAPASEVPGAPARFPGPPTRHSFARRETVAERKDRRAEERFAEARAERARLRSSEEAAS